jgi:hypothetical protein
METTGGNMRDNELKRMVYGHHCLSDDKLAEIETAFDGARVAEPGDWRVRDGRIVRYGAWTPVVATAALHFLAMTFGWVPQMLRCIRTLEDALRLAWISESSARRELTEERARHAATIERINKGETGPLSDLHAIVESIELGGTVPRPGMIDYPDRAMSDEEHVRRVASCRNRLIDGYVKKIAAWARGQQIEGDFHNDPDVEQLRRLKADRDRYEAEEKERFAADRKFVAALAEELKLTKAQKKAHLERAKARVKKCPA